MSLSAQATLAKTFVNAVPRSFGAAVAAPSSTRALNILKHSSNDDDDHKRNDDKKWSQPRAYSTTRVIPSGSTVKFAQQQQRFYSKKVETTQIPDFSAYKKTSSATTNENGRALHYVMMGTTGFVGAMAAKNLVVDFLTQLTPADDVLALAKAEVDISGIPEGKNVTIKWRGKPVFIRHRTQAEIDEANSVALNQLRDPETDTDRVKKPEWLVVLGICTHLGCVPIGEAGDYDGWYCPCHGSHYDISGRIRKGPAPLNLEIPPYDFNEDNTKLIIG